MTTNEGKPEHGDDADAAKPAAEGQPGPAIHPEAIHPERIHPAPIAASLENLEELFAPDEKPANHEYGVQPPG